MDYGVEYREQRDRKKYLDRINSPINRFLNRRTQPNTRGFVSRLGYNIACTSYTQQIEIGRFSGSSLNRAQQQKRKHELENLLKKKAKIFEKVGTTIYEYDEYQREIEAIRSNLANIKRTKKRVSKSLSSCSKSVHLFSKRSRAKVRDKATAFYRSCGKQKTFATLTFLSAVDDLLGVRILNKFLTSLRETYPRLKYLWVAERQTENELYPNNIHFHLIINQRLPVRHYNALWVLQQYNSGVRFQNVTPAEIGDRFEADTVHEILNPFDIKNIKTIYGLSFYLTKYITKNRSDGFDCLAWHCSRSVSKLFTKTIVSRSCMSVAGSSVNCRINYKTGELREAKLTKGAFYHLYYIENKPYFLREMAEVEQINVWILGGMIPDKIPEIDDLDISKFFNN